MDRHRGARAGALLLDLTCIGLGLLAFFFVLGAIGFGLFDLQAAESAGPALELVMVLIILLLFLARYGYFLWFELGPRVPRRANGCWASALPRAMAGG